VIVEIAIPKEVAYAVTAQDGTVPVGVKVDHGSDGTYAAMAVETSARTERENCILVVMINQRVTEQLVLTKVCVLRTVLRVLLKGKKRQEATY
jgi:hypothetical protein